MIIERDDFVKTLGSLVDPKDIKWIFLTHDDHIVSALRLSVPNSRIIDKVRLFR